jgi:hypothetical protein
MLANTTGCRDLVQIAPFTAELRRLRDCGDDDRIDRAFNAACRQIWGYTLDDFDDESLSAKDHTWLDRLTCKRARDFAIENGYDLIDPGTGDIVTDWWGFTWMMLAEKRGLLTPEGRAAAWRRYDAKLMEETKVAGVIRGRG